MARFGLSLHEGGKCPYCERRMTCKDGPSHPVKDHVVPQIRGGVYTIVVCHKCNSDKRDFTLNEWCAYMRRTGDRRLSIVEKWIADNPNINIIPHTCVMEVT